MRSFRSLLSVLVFGLALPLFGADEILMKNGDRVTGSIVKKEKDTVTIKSVHFGTVTLPWAEIAKINTETPLRVVLSNGVDADGRLTTSGEKIAVTVEGKQQEVAPAEVVALRNEAEQKAFQRLLNPGWTQLWTVTGSFGIAGTRGNASTSTFTVPITAARTTRTDKTTVYFNAIRATANVRTIVNGVAADTSATTAQAVRGGWAYSRNLKPRLFWNVFNDYEYDRFQNLDLRTVVGSGLGFVAWKGERGKLDLVGGGAWNREKFDPVRPLLPFVRNSAEAFWGNDFVYSLSSRVNLTQNYRMFNNLTNTGVFRQNFDAGVTAKLTGWLTWNAALSSRYLSNPVPGRKNNDFLYTTGLGFVLSR